MILECVGGPLDGQKKELFPGQHRILVALPRKIATVGDPELIPATTADQRVGSYDLVIPRKPNEERAYLLWMGE